MCVDAACPVASNKPLLNRINIEWECDDVYGILGRMEYNNLNRIMSDTGQL